MRLALLGFVAVHATALRLGRFDDNFDEGVSFEDWKQEQETPKKIGMHKGQCPTDDKIEQQHPITPAEHYQGTECYLSAVQQKNVMNHITTSKNYCQTGKASQHLYMEAHGTCPTCLWKRGKHLTKTLAPLMKEGGLNKVIAGKKFIFSGDSMIRGMFVTLVGAFRTAEHQIDYNSKLSARYVTTPTQDEMQLLIQDFANLHDPLPFAQKDAFSLSFLWADMFPTVVTGMDDYFKDYDGTVDHYSIMPTCTWGTGTASEDVFKDVLKRHVCTADKKTGCAKQISVLACPTEFLGAKGKAWANAAIKANAQVKQWTTDLTKDHTNIYHIDFNQHIADTPGGTVGDAAGNWHYVCAMQPKVELWTGDATKFDMLPREDGTCLARQGNPYVSVVREMFQKLP